MTQTYWNLLQSTKKIYCLDADFQLVRKLSSGKQWRDPYHAYRIFLDQKLVDQFVTDYSADRGYKEAVSIIPFAPTCSWFIVANCMLLPLNCML